MIRSNGRSKAQPAGEGLCVNAHALLAGLAFCAQVVCAFAATWWVHSENGIYFLGVLAGVASVGMWAEAEKAWNLRKKRVAA